MHFDVGQPERQSGECVKPTQWQEPITSLEQADQHHSNVLPS